MELETFDLDRPLSRESFVPFLNKAKCQLGSTCQIVEIQKGQNELRPIFVGKFNDGKYKFDFNQVEMRKFLDRYGDIPRKWVGLKIKLKSNPYKNKGREGLSLVLI